MGHVVDTWQRSRMHRVLRLGGYVAFDLPRVVTALGTTLLLGTAVVLGYVSIVATPLPLYFEAFCAAMVTGCLLAAAALWLGANPVVPQYGWRIGSGISALFLGVYLLTRMVSLAGLGNLTGRWDVAPGTFALAFAAGFGVVHLSILLGFNVAYPQRRNWHD